MMMISSALREQHTIKLANVKCKTHDKVELSLFFI